MIPNSGGSEIIITKKAPKNETPEQIEERFANATKQRFQEARERFARGEVHVDRWWWKGKKYDNK